MTSAASKRLICPRCGRPQAACICHWITPIANRVEVLILQHPLEVNNAKGSARLLHLSLRRSRLRTGEIFAEPELQALLYQPLPSAPDATEDMLPPAHTILLYPAQPAHAAGSPIALPPAVLAAPERLRLVVLDGTWRKSRKMLYCNPLLQQLPRLPLAAPPASRYWIRQAHQPEQLSTLEAGCQALMQLEQAGEKYHALLRAFDGFVAQQLAYRPRAATAREAGAAA